MSCVQSGILCDPSSQTSLCYLVIGVLFNGRAQRPSPTTFCLVKKSGILCAVCFFDRCGRYPKKRHCSRLWQTAPPVAVLQLRRRTRLQDKRVRIPTFNQNKKDIRRCPFYFGGESGIRTHGCFHIAGFQDRCLQPTRPSLRMVRQLYYHKKICLSIVFFKTGILY